MAGDRIRDLPDDGRLGVAGTMVAQYKRDDGLVIGGIYRSKRSGRHGLIERRVVGTTTRQIWSLGVSREIEHVVAERVGGGTRSHGFRETMGWDGSFLDSNVLVSVGSASPNYGTERASK